MKKNKLIINLIYIVSFLLIGIVVIFFTIRTVKKGMEIYFYEIRDQEKSSFDYKKVDEIINLLREFKQINE